MGKENKLKSKILRRKDLRWMLLCLISTIVLGSLGVVGLIAINLYSDCSVQSGWLCKIGGGFIGSGSAVFIALAIISLIIFFVILFDEKEGYYEGYYDSSDEKGGGE